MKVFGTAPPGTLEQARDENGVFRKEFTAPIGEAPDFIEKAAITVFSRAFWALGVVGGWILWLSSQALIPLLTAKKFITYPLVNSGWPIVQGIANLGFIIAMLAIAGSTVLRIDSYSARRMIPRLLIAALLINFSLVVGGVLIDISRLVMAVIVRAISGGNIEQLAKSILEGSQVVKAAYDTSSVGFLGE